MCFTKYPAEDKLFNSFLTELVDSPNSFARLFKYPLLAIFKKNLMRSLNLVLDVISVSNIKLAIKVLVINLKSKIILKIHFITYDII